MDPIGTTRTSSSRPLLRSAATPQTLPFERLDLSPATEEIRPWGPLPSGPRESQSPATGAPAPTAPTGATPEANQAPVTGVPAPTTPAGGTPAANQGSPALTTPAGERPQAAPTALWTQAESVEEGGPSTAPQAKSGERASAPTSCLVQFADPSTPADKAALIDAIAQVPNISGPAAATLKRDLGVFPSHLLQLLKNDELLVLAVADGQTLADTPRLPSVDPAAYHSQSERAVDLYAEATATARRAIADEVEQVKAEGGDWEFRQAYLEHQQSALLGGHLAYNLIRNDLGFSVVLARRPVSLSQLADSRQIEPENRIAWEETFKSLNQGHIDLDGELVSAHEGVLMLPFTYYKGRPVSEVTLKSCQGFASLDVQQNMGQNIPSDRSIVLHAGFLTDPAPLVGHHRVAVHETGHALDHALERLEGFGYGAEHRRFIDGLYARDLADYQSGRINRFTSPRAMDNAREYFADSVEAFCTQSMDDGQEYYKPTNHRQALQERNPELFAYLEKVFSTPLPPDAKPRPPVVEDDSVTPESLAQQLETVS